MKRYLIPGGIKDIIVGWWRHQPGQHAVGGVLTAHHIAWHYEQEMSLNEK